MTDSVAVDAKRILLRYGAPIAILDKVSEPHRIEFAREIAKTTLPDREARLRQLLAEHGYTDAATLMKGGRGKRKGGASPAAQAATKAPAAGKGEASPSAQAVTKARAAGKGEAAPTAGGTAKAGKKKPTQTKATVAKAAKGRAAKAKAPKAKPDRSKNKSKSKK